MSNRKSKTRANPYEKVVRRILKRLEEGTAVWTKPWASGQHIHNGISGYRFTLFNMLVLADYMQEMRWGDGRFATYWQIQNEGGYVRRGEHGVFVFLHYPIFEKDEDGKIVKNENGRDEIRRWVKDAKPVFNIQAQTEGLPDEYYETAEYENQGTSSADQIIADYVYRETIGWEVSDLRRAYYDPEWDHIHLPYWQRFKSGAKFYQTAFHEMTHSTGYIARLDRDAVQDSSFRSHSYGQEELVAEIGASMLLARVGLDASEMIDDAAAYCNGWLGIIKESPRIIVDAAKEAELAVEYIVGEGEESSPKPCENRNESFDK